MSAADSYFVAEDTHGDLWVWRERDDSPMPVLCRRWIANDPDLWDAVVTAIEGES